MKKQILMAVAATCAASGAMARGVDFPTVTAGSDNFACDGQPNGSGAAADGKASVWGGSGSVPTNTDMVFTRAGFDVQCSNNVYVVFREVGPTLAGVGSGSAKGNQSFAGSTNGGAVSPAAACASTGCTQADATSAMSNALDAATKT